MTFYVLEHPNRQTDCLTEYVSGPQLRTGEAPRCGRCGKFIGMLEWLPPFEVELRFWGSQYGDVAFGGTELLLSERFLELWRQDGLVWQRSSR